jgi:proteasome lid subunit RPN8/RPN11
VPEPLEITLEAWLAMLGHARASYPEECCGVMLGSASNAGGMVHLSVRLANSAGSKAVRYELRVEDLARAGAEADARGMQLLGIYHSHADADAGFSAADLAGSWPCFSFVVLSIRDGQFDDVTCWRPNLERTEAAPQPLVLK